MCPITQTHPILDQNVTARITSVLLITRPESSRSARILDQTSEIKREFTGPLCAHFLKGTIDFREVFPGAASGEAFGMQNL